MMKIRHPSLGEAITLLVIGLILGTVFIIGVQHWNEEVTREDCVMVESTFVSSEERRARRRWQDIDEISIDCSNGECYYIDKVSVSEELRNKVSKLSPGDKVTFLIHPNSSSILEFTTEKDALLRFEDTIALMGGEATGFLVLGAFMYFCALVGVCYMIRGFIDLK